MVIKSLWLYYPGPLFSPDDWSELGETVMQSCALRSIPCPLSGPYAYKIKSIFPSCHFPSPSIRLFLLIPQPSRQSPDGFYHTKNAEVSELQILPHWLPDDWRFFWKKWINWLLWPIRAKTVGLSVGFPVGWWIFRSDCIPHTLISISVSMLLFPHSHVNSIP